MTEQEQVEAFTNKANAAAQIIAPFLKTVSIDLRVTVAAMALIAADHDVRRFHESDRKLKFLFDQVYDSMIRFLEGVRTE